MNASLSKTILAIALSGASAFLFASANAAPVEVTDQVVASFNRLLNHAPARAAVAAVPKDEADPLRASLNAVLWEQPSYHLPVMSASRPRLSCLNLQHRNVSGDVKDSSREMNEIAHFRPSV
ncbi:MAG TPA: hypothetical protein VJ603_06645 [Paucimonas sp.]|nr:hypothetical protein [Paucimonas sp.]HJW54358.1 hypothetical protein [Burkholderiaceae bacterium]